MRRSLALFTFVHAVSAGASPNVVRDDPRYDELARLRADGAIGPFSGGFLPLTERRVDELLGRPRQAPPAFWIRPVERLELTTLLFDERDRPYDTPLRPRDLTVGAISIACEHEEGRPCGDGAGGFLELDSSAGYRDLVSASVRLRAQAGESFADMLALDRLYVNSELGPVALEVGRDVLGFGPSSHTQLGWGDNAPPITHARVSTSRPFELTSDVHASAAYVVGVLRSPQRYPHDLVTISHVELDVGTNVELGLIQLLQLGGDGAPGFGLWDFIAEHFRRRDPSASASDSSNRRFGGDVAVRVPALAGARFYYSLVFEDIRKAWIDALHYDADHLLGVELAAIGPCRRHGFALEWQQTGARSQEHSPRTTGFTNMGYVVGSPLGPGARSLYAGGRIELAIGTLYPWGELAWLSSDTYLFIAGGPIEHVARGVTESRYRVGARLSVPLGRGVSVEGVALLERVEAFAFDPARARNNAGVRGTLLWSL